ncbi:MAG: hypothetical protein PHC62_08680 [Candidatus Izemoplasmatales bacterium]|nr:hypothetical protein [Candidatus Izemoplasmatales bacterium]
MRIQLKDGTYEWVETPEQLNRLIEQYIGKDAIACLFNFIEPVRDKLDDIHYEYDRDLDKTESLINEADNMLGNIESGI